MTQPPNDDNPVAAYMQRARDMQRQHEIDKAAILAKRKAAKALAMQREAEWKARADEIYEQQAIRRRIAKRKRDEENQPHSPQDDDLE